MIKREESRHDFAFLAGVVIGAVAGALGTLAMAPRAGAETREKWRARIEEMPVEDLKSRAAHLREAAASGSERLREAASSASAGGVVETTRSRVTELVDRSPLPVTLGDTGSASSADADTESLASVAEEAEARLRAAAEEGEEGADQLIQEASAGIPTEGDSQEGERLDGEQQDRPREE